MASNIEQNKMTFIEKYSLLEERNTELESKFEKKINEQEEKNRIKLKEIEKSNKELEISNK